VDKRAFQRIPVSLQARLYWGNNVYPGTVNNLSKKGMLISSKMCPPYDSVLEVNVTVKNEVMRFPGNVRWSEMTDLAPSAGDNNTFGVELLAIPGHYPEYIRNLRID
jgi:hypothetical protein